MKSTLRASLLKGPVAMPGWQLPGSGLVIMETPSGSGLMGAHAYSCDRGMGIPRQVEY